MLNKLLLSGALAASLALPAVAQNNDAYWGHPDAWPDTPGSAPAPVAAPNSGQPTPYPSVTNPGHHGSNTPPELIPGSVHNPKPRRSKPTEDTYNNEYNWGHPDSWPDIPGSAPAPTGQPNPDQSGNHNPGHYGSDILPELVPGTVHSIYKPRMGVVKETVADLSKAVIVHFKRTAVQSFIECTITEENVAHYFDMVKANANGGFSKKTLPDGGYLLADGRPAAELAPALLKGKWGNWLLSACPADVAATAPKIALVFRKSIYVQYADMGGLLVEARVSEDNKAETFARYHLGLVSVENGVYTVVPLKGQKIAPLLKRLSKMAYVKSATLK
ncbi:MAG TPA: hypothetical protein PLL10_07525 [Elusimicrobiales bacterium]|nr:hypothetical protein [Elusimicrobiales bacterium]